MNHAGFLHSERLKQAGFAHAFFTRQGGVSQGAYASLNFSFGVGDDPECVNENLRRAGHCLGVEPARICFVSQVHGRAVVALAAEATRAEVMHQEGDAVVALRGALACAVRTADCVPILLADPQTGAVAAVHSGWRGTVANVTQATVQCMTTEPSRLIAAIGPHIEVNSFEVGVEVAVQLQNAAPQVAAVVEQGSGNPRANLRAVVELQLKALGVRAIDHIVGDTFRDETLFFSYRRDGKRSGRLMSAIVPLR
jgi:YfiH family protein